MSSSIASTSMENHPIYILIDELKSADIERKKLVITNLSLNKLVNILRVL